MVSVSLRVPVLSLLIRHRVSFMLIVRRLWHSWLASTTLTTCVPLTRFVMWTAVLLLANRLCRFLGRLKQALVLIMWIRVVDVSLSLLLMIVFPSVVTTGMLLHLTPPNVLR